MSSIGIITDSTSGISRELAEEYDIKVMPLKLIFGDEIFLDGVDLDSEAFLRKLESSPQLPTTSQPSPGEFVEAYKQMAEKYEQLISVHISSAISGTIESARQAAQSLKNMKIEIIDSKVTSISLLMLVERIARDVRAGMSMDAVLGVAKKVVDQLQLFLTVDTLEYLHKGGRIGAAQNLVGSVLNLKPVLYYKNGIVDALEKVRGRNKSLARMVELAAEKLRGAKAEVAVAYYADEAAALEVRDMVAKELNVDPDKIRMSLTSAVVAAHASPRAVGMGFYPALD